MESSQETQHLFAWAKAGEVFCAAAPSWYEFLCGPVTVDQIKVMSAFLTGGILPFDSVRAQLAAQLFNATTRLRRLRVDAMIAATAIEQKAALATLNISDFKLFVPHGLELATGGNI